MRFGIANQSTCGNMLLLAAAGITAAAGPVIIGIARVPQTMAQSRPDPPATPAFEVASVRPSVPGESNPPDIPRNLDSSPGHFVMRNVSLRYCLEWAYDLKDYEIEGPDWINYANRYDIVANAPAPPAPDNEMRLMLQTLLTERFQLKLHKEMKTLDVYALLPGKGAPKLKDPAPGEQSGVAGSPTAAGFIKQPLSRLTFLLTRRMDRPVIDMTGIEGLYDYTLNLSGLNFNGDTPADGAPSIFTAVQEDLGLRLQAQKAPVQILVVDQAERIPTEN
jgi:uncharacterized protein (TIGR03435 family)